MKTNEKTRLVLTRVNSINDYRVIPWYDKTEEEKKQYCLEKRVKRWFWADGWEYVDSFATIDELMDRVNHNIDPNAVFDESVYMFKGKECTSKM